jgi:pilus assembly protein CpaE
VKMELRTLRGGTSEQLTQALPPASETITVFSPKGGVGKTLIACNIAVAASTVLGRRTLLVDLDLDSGDVAVHLDLAEGPSINDLIPYCTDLRPEILRRFVIQHKPSGADVLAAPPRPEMAEFVKASHVAGIVDCARRAYQTIVIDTPPALDNDLVYECLERSDKQVLMVTQDLTCVRQAHTAIELLRRLGFDPEERTRIVVNRFGDSSLLTLAKIKSFLGVGKLVSIAEARDLVERSVLDGRPLVNRSDGSNVARDVASVAFEVLGAPMPPKINDKPGRFLQAVRRLW